MTEQEIVEALARDLVDQERVSNLTNQQLVEEILSRMDFSELDTLIEEACTRLDPEWATRDFPEEPVV